jgi:enamine deaminase RidA (YjgF/YER057c/UK114 family)
MFGLSAIRPCAKAITRSTSTALPAFRSFATAITRINTEDPRMSKAVVHNGIVYLSGLIDTTGTDVTSQTKSVLKEVDELLSKAGTNKKNILSASICIETTILSQGRTWPLANALTSL